ncbi:hypothetical protein ACH5RR_035646 [Cinchona calisaya]|uniref:Protein kinase domain-containing protein n=1 Tax=Cinchona calisaya TaxID=153742 RepID=A0ABD2Y5P0_9GENT
MEKGMEADFSRMIIKKHLASGAFGSVYKALYDGREVAVKVLDLGDDNTKTTLLHAFMQEFIVWNKLDHPNIAKFIGAKGTSDLRVIPGHGKGRMPRNGCCIVAEYVGGGTLSSYLWKNRIRKLPLNVVIQLALDAARGLCYLHSRKVVHRDVKTDNMLLDNSRRVKIIDFGVSRFEALNPTEMTAQTGTAGYMAPEVLCSSPYDHKCDVFSFGICLWEIYCCARPNSTTSSQPDERLLGRRPQKETRDGRGSTLFRSHGDVKRREYKTSRSPKRLLQFFQAMNGRDIMRYSSCIR